MINKGFPTLPEESNCDLRSATTVIRKLGPNETALARKGFSEPYILPTRHKHVPPHSPSEFPARLRQLAHSSIRS